MKNSQQHLGNEANLATFSLSHDVIFFMVSPLLGRFLVSFNLQSAICGLQSAVCSLQMSYTDVNAVFSLNFSSEGKVCTSSTVSCGGSGGVVEWWTWPCHHWEI